MIIPDDITERMLEAALDAHDLVMENTDLTGYEAEWSAMYSAIKAALAAKHNGVAE